MFNDLCYAGGHKAAISLKINITFQKSLQSPIMTLVSTFCPKLNYFKNKNRNTDSRKPKTKIRKLRLCKPFKKYFSKLRIIF